MQNNNDGIYNKFELLDSCIDTLCNLRIPVKDLATVGKPVVDVINRLAALKNGMQEEEKAVNANDGEN